VTLPLSRCEAFPHTPSPTEYSSSEKESKIKFTVVAHNALHFQALRDVCCKEDDFVRSLSRCRQWAASGGKSGATWEKTLGKWAAMHTFTFIFIYIYVYSYRRTHSAANPSPSPSADDRFVIKRLPRIELDSFTEFSRLYFNYLAKAHYYQMPTLLAKVFGLYSINYRSAGKTIKHCFMVMENLFYGHNIVKVRTARHVLEISC
jgi:hypothetical protein